MKPLPDDLALANDQGADHRIWADCSLAFRCQAKGQSHEVGILLCAGHRLLRVVRDEPRLGRAVTARARDAGAFFFAGFTLDAAMAACAAANLAIATRKGEQLT